LPGWIGATMMGDVTGDREDASMHRHAQDRDEAPRRRRLPSDHADAATALAARAASTGRTDALTPAAILRLQRAVGNAGVAQALDGDDVQESPVKEVVGQGGGTPLEPAVRERMEASFGTDFSDVRVHAGADAAASAGAVDAHAYTVGSEIVLGDGQAQGSVADERTLAHELAHVVQQRSGPVEGTPAPGGISISDPGDRFERAAETTADRVLSTGSAGGVGGQVAPAVQRGNAPEEDDEVQALSIQRSADDRDIAPVTLATAHRERPSAVRPGWLDDEDEPAADSDGSDSSSVAGQAGSAWDAASNAVGEVASSAYQGAETVGGWVEQGAEAVGQAAGDAYDWGTEQAGAAWDSASDAVGGAIDWASDQVETLASEVGNAAGAGIDPGAAIADIAGGEQSEQLGTGTPGASYTKVGPPTNSTYSVSGDLDAVAATINARTEAGSVSTAIASQDFDIRDQGGAGEKVVAARIQVSQVVELPVWTDKSQAPAKMQAEWNRFSAALAAHEAGHVQKDVGGFAGAHTKAIGKNNADADAAIAGVEAATTKVNADYDTATDHGRNAGTKLQTNLGQVIKVP
jgi:hypothetical protein